MISDWQSLLETLIGDFNLPEIFSRIVSRRVGEAADVRFYTGRSLANLCGPFLLKGIGGFVERISQAISDSEKTMIFSDNDADGICSLALMNDFLKSKGMRPILRIPSQEEGYGINRRAIDEAATLSVTLILMLDCGSSQRKEVAYARSLGIDVMILDHHFAAPGSRPDCVIVNPKDEDTNQPFRFLSACGVCAKAVWAYEFSKLEDYGAKLAFAAFSESRDENGRAVMSAEAIGMENFAPASVMRQDFRSLDEFAETEVGRLIRSSRTFVFEHDPVSRLMPKHWNITQLAPALRLAFKSIGSRSLDDLFRATRAKTMARYPVETLAWAYRRAYLKSHPSISSDWMRYLDLTAISTIADMVPMRGENILLTDFGLRQLNKRRRQSLLGILSGKSMSEREMDEQDVAFRIAPVINAPKRMENPNVALRLFSETDLSLIDIYSREAVDLNERRKRLRDSLMGNLRDSAHASYMENGRKFIALASKEIPRGLAGLVANGLKTEFGCAVLVISLQEGKVTGSLRMDGLAMEALSSLPEDAMSDFGGHHSAAGFSAEGADSVKRIMKGLRDFVLKAASERQDEKDELQFDAQMDADGIPAGIFAQLDAIRPYGMENGIPRLLVKRIPSSSFSMFKGREYPHLQALVGGEGAESVRFICWNKGALLGSIRDHSCVDALVEPRSSVFRGSRRRQFEIIALYADGRNLLA